MSKIYTKFELAYLAKAVPAGVDWEEMMAVTGRSRDALIQKASSMGLRRPHNNRQNMDAAAGLRVIRTCRNERDIARLYKAAGRNYAPDDLTFKRGRAA